MINLVEELPPGALPQAQRAARYKASLALAAQIKEVIPGGVDSPFRAFHEVGGEAIFFEKALGAKLFDLDGNQYIDYLGAWGPAILGHAHPQVVESVKATIDNGAVFGAPHRLELKLASLIIETIPSVESIRFVNSGTEAVMSAIRLARGFTGREKIVMFEGGYHGHSDSVLASTGHCSSSGLVSAASNSTLMVPYNNLAALEELFTSRPKTIAAVLVEPVCGSMGLVKAQPGFLAGLSQLCRKYGALLIFDEVITGFRVALGGAQALYDIEPDLTCFGKALGGGMPIGAYGGRREIMQKLMPLGDVYQAGTFSGNPATMAGGITTIEVLKESNPFPHMEEMAKILFQGLETLKQKKGYPISPEREGSMFGFNFSERPVQDFADAKKINTKAYAAFFHHLLDQGVYLPPSAHDAAVLSAAHCLADIEETLDKVEAALEFAFNFAAKLD
ncbi:MAG: glutamate-1-semialdehyde 2,1-aminomutase [Candidatus Melainabacteria bacterium]|nr:glutamate-1-semialdehyde 2,1-aminomutase [Candidatus Melainabacteria bacterium]